MNQDHHLLYPKAAYNKDCFAFPYDSIFTSKLLNLPWKYGVQQESVSAHNCERVFDWPPRHYLCNFCDREFSSAQALGGHMNVHRRDRARLRQGLVHPDLNEDHTKLHASTLEKSDSSAIHGLKRPSISPRVCTLYSNQSVISEDLSGFLMKDQTKDDVAIISAKRRRLVPLIEPQHQDVDLELRL